MYKIGEHLRTTPCTATTIMNRKHCEHVYEGNTVQNLFTDLIMKVAFPSLNSC